MLIIVFKVYIGYLLFFLFYLYLAIHSSYLALSHLKNFLNNYINKLAFITFDQHVLHLHLTNDCIAWLLRVHALEPDCLLSSSF